MSTEWATTATTIQWHDKPEDPYPPDGRDGWELRASCSAMGDQCTRILWFWQRTELPEPKR